MHLPQSVSILPSRRLAYCLVGVHLLALVSLWPLRMDGLLQGALAAGILLSCGASFPRCRADRVVFLHLGARGDIEIETASGVRSAANVLAGTTVWPWLVVLHLRLDNGCRVLSLLPDSSGAGGFHTLRLWLKWRAAFV